MKLCRIKSCNIKHRGSLLMCGKHWRMVPPDIQQRVYETFSEFRIGKNKAAYHQAVSDAVNAVLEKENNQLLTGNLNAIH